MRFSQVDCAKLYFIHYRDGQKSQNFFRGGGGGCVCRSGIYSTSVKSVFHTMQEKTEGVEYLKILIYKSYVSFNRVHLAFMLDLN